MSQGMGLGREDYHTLTGGKAVQSNMGSMQRVASRLDDVCRYRFPTVRSRQLRPSERTTDVFELQVILLTSPKLSTHT